MSEAAVSVKPKSAEKPIKRVSIQKNEVSPTQSPSDSTDLAKNPKVCYAGCFPVLTK
jgi:hypothetical protein